MAVSLLAGAAFLPSRAIADSRTVDIESIEQEIAATRTRLDFVRDFVERGDEDAFEKASRAFSDAETQFLLDNYEGCAALLLNAVGVPSFRSSGSYAQALYYLGESLYQTSSYLESRRYLREAVGIMPMGRQYQNAIARLIDLADRTGNFEGVDDYYAAAKRVGPLRSDVVYLYAKWISQRKDIPFEERTRKAVDDLATIAAGEPFYAKSLYYRGALKVKTARPYLAKRRELARQAKGRDDPERQKRLQEQAAVFLDEAVALFAQILALPENSAVDPDHARVRSLANLAVARIHNELGRYEDAIDHYQRIPRESEDYNDSLFETAATFVKMGRYEQALRTADILLLIGKDSVVAPEALLLRGNLEMGMEHFDESDETFAEVVATLSPVKEQVDAVSQRPDPIAYFDELLKRRDGALDIRTLLPKPAQPWLAVDKEVKVARSVGDELSQGQAAIEESQQLAQKLLDTLALGQLNLFPQYQEGNAHAVQLSNALTALEAELVRVQVQLLEDELPSHLRERLRKLESQRAELDETFKILPRTASQYEERKQRFLDRIAELEEKSFDLRRQIDGLQAELVGLQKYWGDTQDERRSHPFADSERHSEFAQYLLLIEQLDEARVAINRQIENERATAQGQAVGGHLEEELRTQYRQQLLEMQELISEASPRLDAERSARLARVNRARLEIDALQKSLIALRQSMHERAQLQAKDYIEQIQEERLFLEEYSRQVEAVEGDTIHLVGEIAYGSLKRVGEQFSDLVMRGEVGGIDVAWAKKQERSSRISALVQDRDKELKRLQALFSEVLNDAE